MTETALARPVPAWPIMGAVAALLLGLILGWWIWHPRSIFEPAADAQLLPSGSLVLQRDPAARSPADVATAAREAGGKLERAFSVTVQPKPVSLPAPSAILAATPHSPEVAAPAAAAPAPECSCSPVTVDLGLIRMRDDTR